MWVKLAHEKGAQGQSQLLTDHSVVPASILCNRPDTKVEKFLFLLLFFFCTHPFSLNSAAHICKLCRVWAWWFS